MFFCSFDVLDLLTCLPSLVLIYLSLTCLFRYNGISATFHINNYDNDVAGAVATLQGSPVTAEDGTAFKVDVSLTARPDAVVTVSTSVSDDTQAFVYPTSIDIDPEDWQTSAEFAIIGKDDDLVDGTRLFTVSFETTSTDSNFDGLSISSITALNIDDDVAGFTATVAGASTTGEPGITCCRSTSIDVVLVAQPFDDVTIQTCVPQQARVSLTSSEAGAQAGCVDLVFSPDDYDTVQTVYITGANNDIDDGNQNYDVTLTAIAADPSLDDSFDGKTAVIALINIDDDVAAVTVQQPAQPARVYEGDRKSVV